MPQIELQNISKKYDTDKYVLDGIDLVINEGEFFVIVGASGSGKSTLLRMFAGLEEITGGILIINDKVVNHLPPKDRNLSMVFQNYALYPHLTVEQNIVFGLQAKKVSKIEQQKRLKEAAEMVGLSELLKRKPRQLSGGQRQRVALARAIASQAPLCLMDEPLSNLDAKLRGHMRMEIRRLQRQLGLTLVYVTHDQVEAMTMGDRIMLLEEGIIQQVGDPISLYNEPNNLFVATFIGSPKMNIGRGVIEGDRLTIEECIHIPVKALESGEDQVTIGIRAEHLVYGEGKDKDKTVELELLNIEQLGNETLLAFEVGKEIWTAKWAGQWRLKPGDKVPVHISEKALYFFHSETGKTLKLATIMNENGARIT